MRGGSDPVAWAPYWECLVRWSQECLKVQREIEEVKGQWGLKAVGGAQQLTAMYAFVFPYTNPGGGCPVGWPGKLGSLDLGD